MSDKDRIAELERLLEEVTRKSERLREEEQRKHEMLLEEDRRKDQKSTLSEYLYNCHFHIYLKLRLPPPCHGFPCPQRLSTVNSTQSGFSPGESLPTSGNYDLTTSGRLAPRSGVFYRSWILRSLVDCLKGILLSTYQISGISNGSLSRNRSGKFSRPSGTTRDYVGGIRLRIYV